MHAERIGKMCWAMVTVINHPRSYPEDPFRFLLAKRRSSGIGEKGVEAEQFQRVSYGIDSILGGEMQFFLRNKTLQDSGDTTEILLD